MLISIYLLILSRSISDHHLIYNRLSTNQVIGSIHHGRKIAVLQVFRPYVKIYADPKKLLFFFATPKQTGGVLDHCSI